MAILDGLGFRGLRFLEVTADRRWAVARNIIVLRSRDPATPLDPQHSARIVCGFVPAVCNTTGETQLLMFMLLLHTATLNPKPC